MSDINTFFFIGNLGRDPELNYTASGTAISKFPLAISRVSRDAKGETNEKTTWVNVTAWGKQAENVSKFLGKGSKVGVKGYVDQNSWVGKDGQKKYAINFVSENIQFLSKPSESNQKETTQSSSKRPYQPKHSKTTTIEGKDLDQIPF